MGNPKAMLLVDAYAVGAKIRSSEGSSCLIRMENVAIVKKNARFIKIFTNSFIEEELMEE